MLDVDNGARFETYAMAGGPGDVILNGAAARLVQPGDRVIVITYASYDEAELAGYEPLIVHVDERNRPIPSERAVKRLARTSYGCAPGRSAVASPHARPRRLIP